MNAHDNSEAPMAYTRESVVAYLVTAEREQAQIRLAISEARGRTARARDRAGRLSVLRGEVEDGTARPPAYEDTPISVGAQPVAAAPTASVPDAPVPVGMPPLPDQAPGRWPLAITDMPADPLPDLSARPIPVPDTMEAVNAWPSPTTDDPTRPWHLTAPLGRVAND